MHGPDRGGHAVAGGDADSLAYPRGDTSSGIGIAICGVVLPGPDDRAPDGVPGRLARGIARGLFIADSDRHFAAMRAFDEYELKTTRYYVPGG